MSLSKLWYRNAGRLSWGYEDVDVDDEGSRAWRSSRTFLFLGRRKEKAIGSGEKRD